MKDPECLLRWLLMFFSRSSGRTKYILNDGLSELWPYFTSFSVLRLPPSLRPAPSSPCLRHALTPVCRCSRTHTPSPSAAVCTEETWRAFHAARTFEFNSVPVQAPKSKAADSVQTRLQASDGKHQLFLNLTVPFINFTSYSGDIAPIFFTVW